MSGSHRDARVDTDPTAASYQQHRYWSTSTRGTLGNFLDATFPSVMVSAHRERSRWRPGHNDQRRTRGTRRENSFCSASSAVSAWMSWRRARCTRLRRY